MPNQALAGRRVLAAEKSQLHLHGVDIAAPQTSTRKSCGLVATCNPTVGQTSLIPQRAGLLMLPEIGDTSSSPLPVEY